jgi:hypothetical protein
MRCFLLAVSQASTLDRYTNNFSLFFLLEEFTPSNYPARLPVYTHAFFEVPAENLEAEHEARLVLEGGDRDAFVSEPLRFQPTSSRHRLRMSGLVVPEPGLYRVRVEWRHLPSGPWTRDSQAWPVRANTPLQ